jgi:hypothetical protein
MSKPGLPGRSSVFEPLRTKSDRRQWFATWAAIRSRRMPRRQAGPPPFEQLFAQCTLGIILFKRTTPLQFRYH